METLNALFRKVILANELENNLAAALRFSDPDGVFSGKSGWSFGISQFDTQNNDQALKCLAECGFSSAEIQSIVKQTVDVKPFNARLAAHADVIAKYDEAQLSGCLTAALNFATSRGIPVVNPGGILAIADQTNQYGPPGDGTAAFYLVLHHPVDVQDVLAWRLQTKYGEEHPADCRRRIQNILAILKGL
jgi:hypothetical protein